jgi:hypothetical protein
MATMATKDTSASASKINSVVKNGESVNTACRFTMATKITNNGYINGTYFNPIIPIAHGGNADIGYIDNLAGAAEYCADYTSKVEAPDETRFANMFAKELGRRKVASLTTMDHMPALMPASPNESENG